MTQVSIKILPNPNAATTNVVTLKVFGQNEIQQAEEVLDSTQNELTVECETLGRIELIGIGTPGVVDYEQSASIPPTVEEAKTAKSAHPQPPVAHGPSHSPAHGKSESKKEK